MTNKSTLIEMIRKVLKESDARITKMVSDFKKNGRCFSNLDYNDDEFFKLVKIPYSKMGIASQSGTDLIYYDTKLFDSDRDAIRNKKMNESKLREVSDAEQLWSGNGWTLKKYKNRKGTVSISVENKSGFIDYPIYYDHNGQIAYDYPERIPAAIKKKVDQFYKKMKG